MKRAISMKCNQEQWDSIKDKLVGCRPFRIEPFEEDFYLALYNDKSITNGTITGFNPNREIHETWNEQIFLEACGIETEKIFKGNGIQYWSDFYNKWVDLESTGTTKYRLKPDYSAEIAELQRQIQILKNK